MSTHTRAKAVRWTTVIAAAAVLALTGTGAEAAAPVSGTEAVITIGANHAQPLVSPDGTKAYVVVTGTDNLVQVKAIDTQTDAVTGQVALSTNQVDLAAGLSPDGARLYVANGQQLSVVDTASLTVVANTALPDQPRQAGWNPGTLTGLTVSPDGGTVYVVQNGPTAYRQYGQGRVLAYSTARPAFTGSVQVPGSFTGTAAVRPGGRDLYVGSSGGVFHVSTAGATPALVGTVTGTASALDYYPVFTQDGTRLFALAGGSNGGQADLIDPAADTVTQHLALVSGFADLHAPQLSADGTRFYVAENDYTTGPSVLAVDTATGNVVPAEAVSPDEDGLDGLAAGPDGHTLYVTGTIGTSGKLQIIAN
ncbi:YncE family protein [Kitasatospora sp. NPDC004669]|uniref:YncE family protein n=1 Tax=Kitasatospora sp. NPDC004669 TaxID=3154555 RepID=UPI0033A4E6BA